MMIPSSLTTWKFLADFPHDVQMTVNERRSGLTSIGLSWQMGAAQQDDLRNNPVRESTTKTLYADDC